MKKNITITYTSPDLQPPVFVSTNLSDPQWVPLEMDLEPADASHENRFFLSFSADEGHYQYKLRLGPGDWWVCDDSMPTVVDDQGHKNNSIVVPAESKGPLIFGNAIDSSHTLKATASSKDSSHARNDSLVSGIRNHQASTSPKDASKPVFEDSDSDSVEGEIMNAPLLRHESITLASFEEHHAPLFSHESSAIDNQNSSWATTAKGPSGGRELSRSSSHDSIPEEADPNDPTLVHFPTDQEGIWRHLNIARQNMPEEHAHDKDELPSVPLRAVVSFTSINSTLPRVTEDEELEEMAGLAAHARGEASGRQA